MKKLILAILSIFSTSTTVASDMDSPQQGKFEFSTSIGFEEFEAVIRQLRNKDELLADEILNNIEKFKKSSQEGESQKFVLSGDVGEMVLGREDDYDFEIATFTTKAVHQKIDDAYERATEELGM